MKKVLKIGAIVAAGTAAVVTIVAILVALVTRKSTDGVSFDLDDDDLDEWEDINY